MPQFANFKDFYTEHLTAMVITRPAAVDVVAKRIIALRVRYENVQKLTGVPWYFIGALHFRECENNMRGCLHNGQLIIGTGRRTTIEPPGRGPFNTFEDSAVDALRLQGFLGITDWSMEMQCFTGEEFNGEGYHYRGLVSPYIFAGTNQYSHGLFLSDGHFSNSTIDERVGIAPVIKRVLELVGDGAHDIIVADKAPDGHFVIPAADPPKDEPRVLTKSEKREVIDSSTHLTLIERLQNGLTIFGAVGSAAVAVLGQVKAVVYDPMTWVLVGLGLITFVVLERVKVKTFAQYLEGRYFPSGLQKMLGLEPLPPQALPSEVPVSEATPIVSVTTAPPPAAATGTTIAPAA